MWDDHFEDIKRFRREMNRLFDSFWSFPEFGKVLPAIKPLVREPLTDLRETDKELIATMEIPGVDKRDIQLNITENNIEVRVDKKEEAKIEKEGYIKAERTYRGFYRLLNLPAAVIPEQSKASYKNGILEIIMQKAEKKKTKKIEIE